MNAMLPIVMDFRPAYWQITADQRKFVDGYVADIETIAEKNSQRLLAALQAPFPFPLDNRALALLALPLIRAAITERVQELSALYDISIYRTLKELTCIAYSNIDNYISVDAYGVPTVDLSQCTKEQLSAVKSFEIEDKPRGGRKVKFVLHDKIAALNIIARYQGLLGEDNEHWQKQEQSTKPVNGKAGLPAGSTDDQAAQMYARVING